MIGSSLLKKKILESAFIGYLTDLSEKDFTKTKIDSIMKNYDSKRKPVSKELRGNLENNYDYYGATGKIDMINDYIFDGNYLLIGEDGGNFYVDRENSFVVDGKFWANNHVHVLSSGNSITNKYVMYYLNSLDLPKMGLISGVAVPKLNQKNLNSIFVPMCPIDEQERIINKIDILFEMINKKEKNDQEKEKLKKVLKEKILDNAIHGSLIKNDISLKSVDMENVTENIPFKIPNNWKWCNLKKCCDKLYAGGDKTSNFSKEKTKEYQIPVIANGITNDGIIGYTDIPTETDSCITISGRGTIGYTSIRNYPFSPVVRLITIKPKNILDINYLKYVLSYLVESSKGTSIQQLTIPMIKDKLIPIPPIEEQKRIVEKVESLFGLIEQL